MNEYKLDNGVSLITKQIPQTLQDRLLGVTKSNIVGYRITDPNVSKDRVNHELKCLRILGALA